MSFSTDVCWDKPTTAPHDAMSKPRFPIGRTRSAAATSFICPPRVLENGATTFGCSYGRTGGGTFDSEFRIDVQQGQDIEDYATIRRHISRAEVDLYQDMLDRLECRPTFRLLLAARVRSFRKRSLPPFARWAIRPIATGSC